MRPVVAVDLAAKFSAIVALDAGGQVYDQMDSAGYTHRGFANTIWDVAEATRAVCSGWPVVVIEDLPQHVPSSMVAKTVSQLQGRIIHACPYGRLADLYFVPPHTWERDMGVWRQELPDWERIAIGLGYDTIPDLVTQRGLVAGTRGQGTAVTEALKQRTDYVAAFLLGRWAQMCMHEDRTWDPKTIKQYLS